MNEVEKMYRNVLGYVCNMPDVACFHECEKCDSYITFTAEKQIEILQFCLKWGQVHILKGIDDEYRIENSCYRQGYQPTIADAIANYINEKWEKLTPEERKQIRNILESEVRE